MSIEISYPPLATPSQPTYYKENELEGLVVDEWRGASGDGADIVCDVAGGVCPWRVVDGTNSADWNISASAAVLMVRPLYFHVSLAEELEPLFSQFVKQSLVRSAVDVLRQFFR